MPDPEMPERLLGRPQDSRRGGEALLHLTARALGLPLAEVRRDLAPEPGSRGRLEEQQRRQQHAAADDRRHQRGADRVERAGKQRLRLLHRAGSARHPRLDPRLPDRELEPLAGPGVGQIRDRPGPAKLGGECRVDGGERSAGRSARVASAGLRGQPLQRRRREARALDRDRIDGDLRQPGSVDRLGEGRVARDLLTVRQQHEHARRVNVGRERLAREDDRVVESGAANRIDLEVPQRRVGVCRGRREAGQQDGALADRDDGDPVAARLRAHERARCGGGVEQRLAEHRLGAVDREHDTLLPPEVGGLVAGDSGCRSRSAARSWPPDAA